MGHLWRGVGGAGGSGGGIRGGVSGARRLPQSDGNSTLPSRQLETLVRHCGTGAGMQGCSRFLETSVSSGGPSEGLEDSPKDWCITATDATARATLLTYATASRQDSCGREDKTKQQAIDCL